jgi:hypothetical protein
MVFISKSYRPAMGPPRLLFSDRLCEANHTSPSSVSVRNTWRLSPPLPRMTSWHAQEKSISFYILGKHCIKRHFITSHVPCGMMLRNTRTLFLPGLMFVTGEMLHHDRLTTLSTYSIFWLPGETTHQPSPHQNPSSFRFPDYTYIYFFYTYSFAWLKVIAIVNTK